MSIMQLPNSRVGRWCFNRVLWRMIPFNRAHGITVEQFQPHEVICGLPYKTANCNHLRGLHACALATVAEYAAGLLLVQSFDFKVYRIIMSDLKMTYLHQGRGHCLAKSQLAEQQLSDLKLALDNQQAPCVQLESKVFDHRDRHVATCVTQWQIKNWSQVKTAKK